MKSEGMNVYLDTSALNRIFDDQSQPRGIGGHDAASCPPIPRVLYVVAGERRCEAAKKAGPTEVPAILVEGKHGEIALVENLLRQDLTAVEEAEVLDRLMKEESYTREQLGVIIGKARELGDMMPHRVPQFPSILALLKTKK